MIDAELLLDGGFAAFAALLPVGEGAFAVFEFGTAEDELGVAYGDFVAVDEGDFGGDGAAVDEGAVGTFHVEGEVLLASIVVANLQVLSGDALVGDLDGDAFVATDDERAVAHGVIVTFVGACHDENGCHGRLTPLPMSNGRRGWSGWLGTRAALLVAGELGDFEHGLGADDDAGCGHHVEAQGSDLRGFAFDFEDAEALAFGLGP